MSEYLQQPVTLYDSADNSRFEAGFLPLGSWLAHLRGEDVDYIRVTRYQAFEETLDGADTAAQGGKFRRLRAAAAAIPRDDDFGVARGENADAYCDAWKSAMVPAASPAGRFSGRREFPDSTSWTGVVHFDCDHLIDAAAMRDSLFSDDRVAYAGVSISGEGVHFGVLPSRPPSSLWEYPKMWVVVQEILRHEDLLPNDARRLKEISDQGVKDPTRLRFFAHDPDLRVREQPRLIAVPDQRETWHRAREIVLRAKVGGASGAPAASGASGGVGGGS